MTVRFWVLADTGYTTKTAAQLSAICAAPNPNAEFMLHVGDIWARTSPKRTPSLAAYQAVATQLKLSSVPVIVVPGDNEFNDMSVPTVGLECWRTAFAGIESHWPGVLTVSRQENRSENCAFVKDNVLFIGLHLTGTPVHDKAEWTLRANDCATWVESNLTTYASARACIIWAHARPTLEIYKTKLLPRFKAAINTFNKQALLLGGDVHAWELNKKYQGVTKLQRITLPQTGIGKSYPKPLLVTVDNDGVISWDRKQTDYVLPK